MPSPVLNWPLKSAHHSSFGASTRFVGRPGWPIARRRRVTLQDVAHRRALGQVPARVTPLHERNQLLRTPARVATPRLNDRLDNVRCGLIGTCVRSSRSFLKSSRALLKVALDQSVAGLAAYAVASAQLGERERLTEVVGDELRLLVHRRGLTPWHRPPSCSARSLLKLSAMSLD